MEEEEEEVVAPFSVVPPWDGDFGEFFNPHDLYRNSGNPFVPKGTPSEQLEGHLRARDLLSSVLLLFIGPPASGKTTLTNQLRALYGERCLVASTVADVRRALSEGCIVISDAVNHTAKKRGPLLEAARASGAPAVVVLFDFPRVVLEKRLIARNELRSGGGEGYPYGEDCDIVPLKAQKSLTKNTAGVVGGELGLVALALAVHTAGDGTTRVTEARAGALLGISSSHFGRGVCANAEATRDVVAGRVPAQPNWNGYGVHTIERVVVTRGTAAAVLLKLEGDTGLSVAHADELGSQRLCAALAGAPFDVSASGERISAQRQDVEEALLRGGMAALRGLFAALRAEGALKGLFAALYVLGARMSIHKDKLFDKDGARIAVKVMPPGGSSSLQVQCATAGRPDTVADITFTSAAGEALIYYGDQNRCMTQPHAVGPSSAAAGASYTLLVDVYGNMAECGVIVERLRSAIAADGAGWVWGGAARSRCRR